MKLVVVLWSYGILKVVDPTPSQPLYILYDPACRLASGAISVQATGRRSTRVDSIAPVGTLRQGNQTCDVEQLVYPGP
jgi:hypothetical protein